jgi:hypothetical protein
MRKLLVLLLVLAVLLVVADRVAVGVADGQIADRVRTSQNLPEKPSVKIAGFPFLTQVARGRYQDVQLEARGLERDGLRLDDVRIDAQGVRVDVGDLMSGTVSSVPVDHARGSVLLTYDDLNAYLAQRVQVPKLTVARSGSDLKVTGTVNVPVIDRPVSLSGNAAVSIEGENVTLFPTAVEAVTGFLPSFAQGSAKEALTVRFALRGLPLGVRLDSAQVTDQGIRFTALADGLTLDTT